MIDQLQIRPQVHN